MRVAIAVVLGGVSLAAQARAQVYEDVGKLESERGYGALQNQQVHARVMGGTLLSPGEKHVTPAKRLEPGEYKLRVSQLGEDQGGADRGALSATIINETSGTRTSHPSLVADPPRFRLDTAATLRVEIHNASKQRILIGNAAFLIKRERPPVQVLLYVPDAFAYFPNVFPDAPYGRFINDGTFHWQYYSSGDNTWGFTKTMFLQPSARGESVWRSLRAKNIQTIALSDNFYLLSHVDKQLFDVMWIRTVTPDTHHSDAEINMRAIQWAERHADEDFLAYVHVSADHDVHYHGHRTSTDKMIIEAVERLRQRLPDSLVIMAPDHGPMYQHGWKRGGRDAIGQGWGLFLDTEHIPLLALGPGVTRGHRCDKMWSTRELKELFATLPSEGRTGILAGLNCEGIDVERVVTEGFKDQLAITDRKFHYIKYNGNVPYPVYSAITGRVVRDKFLADEALFDAVGDPQNTRSIGSEQRDALLGYRALAASEHYVRFPEAHRITTRTLRFLRLSTTCSASEPITVRANAPLDLIGEPGLTLKAEANAVTVSMSPPHCFDEFSFETSGKLYHLEIGAPGQTIYLGRGFIPKSERAVLDGELALGLLYNWGSGYGDVFVQNKSRPGLYVFLEDGARAAGKRGDRAASKDNVSGDEVRRMMRSWGYMRESELTDLQ
jgi:hypothetical protein